MTFFQILTYTFIVVIIFHCFNNPRTGFFLYLATYTTRLQNFLDTPRILSPVAFDLFILFILFLKFQKYVNFPTVIKVSKIFLIWVGAHVAVRLLQGIYYADMSTQAITSDVFGFYLKSLILFLVIQGYLNKYGDFSFINKGLLLNLNFFIIFIYLEYFSSELSYTVLFQTIHFKPDELPQEVFRYGKKLISGPGSWVSSGVHFISYLSVIFYYFVSISKKSNLKPISIFLFYFFTIYMIGARAPIVAFIFTVLYFILSSISMRNFLIILLVTIIILFFNQIDFLNSSLFKSFMPFTEEGFNLYYRLSVQLLLIKDIFNIPFIGHSYQGRRESITFEHQDRMEVNIFLFETYDFGLIVAIITIIFFIHTFIVCLKADTGDMKISYLSWMAIFIAYLSNGLPEYNDYMVPIIFLSYGIWKINFSDTLKTEMLTSLEGKNVSYG